MDVLIAVFVLVSMGGAAGTLLGAADTADTQARRGQAQLFAALIVASALALIFQFVFKAA